MSNASTQPPRTPADPAALTVPALALTLERVRRTTHIDGLVGEDGSLRVEAAARDLVRDQEAARPVREARLHVELDRRRTISGIAGTPSTPRLAELETAAVGPGFRTHAADVLADDSGLPLGVLVADLPVAALLSGYAHVRRAAEEGVDPGSVVGPGVLDVMTDVCAGWREGGMNVESIAAGNGVPSDSLLAAPSAPPLQHPEFPLAWHELPVLQPGALRRARRMDVAQVRGEVVVDAFFRDTFMSAGTGELVLHEYSLYAWLDLDLTVLEIQATPRVLPFPECPFAAEQVGALTGVTTRDLTEAVSEKLAGTSGCTHLNDLLLQLVHLPRLLELLPGHTQETA